MSYLGAKNVFDQTVAELILDDESEKKSIAFLLLEDAFSISKMDIAINKPVLINELLLQEYIERLNLNEPLQQIVGFTYFRGRKFKVDKNVLIPRPETEEIIDLVKGLNIEEPSIIDIGTGSGCIAISLQLELSNAKVKAIDISKEALSIARQNAKELKAQVEFSAIDFLKDFPAANQIDLIISNPPYIKDMEKVDMKANVLEHEPHLALFVPNDDALVFYRRIAEYGQKALKTGGYILAEINSHLGKETAQLFEQYEYQSVEIIKDFYGRDRFVKAIWG
ncbi:peptide chain release factor N(5)-glutamine methyltransferase [Jiulongibacter sp. NS-SX5]|uniref:peptide chain release factor N(5)-glutamine methyltransferase n=1 Tax=Jiulongibacter sp. NS-SX5 TaxID=3463854 RepID=UPI004058191D